MRGGERRQEQSINIRFAYITAVVVIFLTEIAIAVGAIGGSFVRGSMGDILAVALIYFLLRTVSGLLPMRAAGSAIGAGFLVEGLQYIHVTELINLRRGSPLYIVLGNTFSASDLIMYVVGGFLALAVDHYALKTFFGQRGVSGRRSV